MAVKKPKTTKAAAKPKPKAAAKAKPASGATPKPPAVEGKPRRRAASGATPPKAAAAAKPRKGASIPPGPGAPSERVLFPKDVYEARKDEIKAPLKREGFGWQYLGEGKGRYHKDHVAIFVEFNDAGTTYHVRAKEKAMMKPLLDEWAKLLGKEAFVEAKAAAEEAVVALEEKAKSDEIHLWELAKPARRAGEPEGIFKRRLAEWETRKPA